MFSRKKQPEICIPVSLDEPLTTESCTTLIMELLKYILYQKQQIPFVYDTLTELQTRYKPTDRNACNMKTAVSSLRVISDNLTSQLHLGLCNVREVVIIIGPTTVSPKLSVKVELPSEILSSYRHMEYQHSSRKPLLNVMRSMFECEEFQEAMTVPLGLTNTFLLLQKSDSNSTSEFFVPKPQYAPPPQTTSCFVIKLTNSPEMEINCSCKNAIKIYHDSPNEEETEETLNHKHCNDYSQTNQTHGPYSWYQSREVIKGFKFSR